MVEFGRKAKTAGVDDMVMLGKSANKDIEENLRLRYNCETCYTYIGEVLIAVNPFKMFPIYTDDHIEKYTAANLCDNPPHIYAVGDDMYRNLMVDKEHQCVIISGESGSGKTVNAKFIMEYLSKVSGGVGEIERVKNVIMCTNPLLEAFGNAKTTRNNNSSRFGKYFTIKFDYGGQPIGGEVSTFLLEKTRVSGIQRGERNFHIFYQLLNGLPNKADFAITQFSDYLYLTADGRGEEYADNVDDNKEFEDVMAAMKLIDMDENEINQVFMLLSGILWLGNIQFQDSGSYDQSAVVTDPSMADYVANCFQVDSSQLQESMLVKELKMGREITKKTLNVVQATNSRNSVAQGIYERLFDYLVKKINIKLKIPTSKTLDVGVLDIYGFEIFDNNGFEQLCINFVNEKLQQIFIELTLKSEQEEYEKEGIRWTPIPFKDNKPLCELIEGKRPAGIFALMDDVCKQNHAQEPEKVDPLIKQKICLGTNSQYLSESGPCFMIQHYAGAVHYSPVGFFDKNRNTLLRNIITTMQNSQNSLLSKLFNNPNDRLISHPEAGARTKRPPSAGATISSQAKDLVTALTRCRPHYVRCIKPNETKQYGDWDGQRVLHQVKYLGLAENIRVRRAGYAYRRLFDQFLQRYNILAYAEDPLRAQPPPKYQMNPSQCNSLMQKILQSLSPDEYQFGKTKLFIKSPESVNLLEDQRERLYDKFARTIQKHLKNYVIRSKVAAIKESANQVVFNKKERNRASIHRKFYGDYLDLETHPEFRSFLGKKERVVFASKCKRYNGRLNSDPNCYLILSTIKLQVLGYNVKQNPSNPKQPQYPNDYELGVKFEVSLSEKPDIKVSELVDGFILIKDPFANDLDETKKSGDCLIEIRFLTEFLYCLQTKSRNPPFVDYLQKSNGNGPDDQGTLFEVKKKKGFMSKMGFKKDAHKRYLHFNYLSTNGTYDLNSKITILENTPKKRHYTILVPQGQDKNVTITVRQPKATKNESIQSKSSDLGHISTSKFNPNSPANQINLFAAPNQDRNRFSRGNSITQKTYKPSNGVSAASQALRGLKGPSGGGVNLGAGIRLGGTTGGGLQLNNQPASAFNNNNNSLLYNSSPIQQSQQPVASTRKQPPVKPPRQKIQKQCKALYDYERSSNEEMDLRVGDIIIIRADADAWWMGKNTRTGVKGLFPGNYVERI